MKYFRRSSRQFIVAISSCLALFLSDHVFALGLMEAYSAALQNDPAYRAALYERRAGQQYKAIGRSYLLPNLSAIYSASKNQADISSDTTSGVIIEQRDYKSEVGAIQLRQPLFSLDSAARYRQGVAQTNTSEAQFAASRQELIVQLASLYAAANYAGDQLALTIAQRDAYGEQRRTNDRMFAKGEGTQTDMLETQAKFDLSEAQVLESRDAMTNACNALASLVGREITKLDPLRDDFRAAPMRPAGFEDWKAIALAQNPEIAAQRYAVETASQEVNKNRAGHAPRLDAVLSRNNNSSDTINTYKQDATINSVGLQLTLPLYAGGSVSALTHQAVANHEKAKANLDAKTSDVLIELRKQYNSTVSGMSRIDALVKSESSVRLLIYATQKSVKGGVRTNLDVLNAQRQMFEAKRDLAVARYNYLISYLRLRKAAGTLSVSDLQTVAAYFTHLP